MAGRGPGRRHRRLGRQPPRLTPSYAPAPPSVTNLGGRVLHVPGADTGTRYARPVTVDLGMPRPVDLRLALPASGDYTSAALSLASGATWDPGSPPTLRFSDGTTWTASLSADYLEAYWAAAAAAVALALACSSVSLVDGQGIVLAHGVVQSLPGLAPVVV